MSKSVLHYVLKNPTPTALPFHYLADLSEMFEKKGLGLGRSWQL